MEWDQILKVEPPERTSIYHEHHPLHWIAQLEWEEMDEAFDELEDEEA